MISLHLLEQFTAFARCGTLSAASEVLHISQPTLSRSMKQLEDELGVALFSRRKNQLSLTPTGIKAAEYAGQVLLAASELESKIKAYDRSLRTVAVGFCAPVPQAVLTPIISTIYGGMTIAADMTDDALFEERLKDGEYQLAVMHYRPADERFHAKKCGSEALYMSLPQGSPLASRPVLTLSDLDGLSILLWSRIGFWMNVHKRKTPNTKYLMQTEASALEDIANNSEYPVFASDYYIRRGQALPGRVNVALADPECRTDYYLVCLASERKKHEALFRRISEETIM